MKTTLIAIGNSRGIRIPKPLIEQCGLTDQVALEVRGRTLLIHAPRRARDGWRQAFAQMAANGDDKLLEPQSGATRWDDTGWQWK